MTQFLLGFLLGVFGLLGYLIWRMLRSDGWDKSNAFNALRLLAHVAVHPEDFGKMWYVKEQDGDLVPTNRPFFYISEDEMETIVGSRPPNE